MAPPRSVQLTGAQQSDLYRIWRQSFQNDTGDIEPNDHTLAFVARLHSFFLALLRASGATSNTITLQKTPEESSLYTYCELFISNNQVCLRGGRHVIQLNHEEFLTELNHFELKGQSATPEFIQRDSFGAFLHHMPQQALRTVSCAAILAIVTLYKSRDGIQQQHIQELNRFLDTCQIKFRFCHVQPQVQMMDVKTSLAYKFVSIQGHVVKARPKRLRVVSADFLCAKCGNTNIAHVFEQGRYSTPTKCTTRNCRSKNFELQRPTSRYMDVQDVRLQEAQEESTQHAGRTPRQLEVELTLDLVDSCRPGDVVLVTGMVQAQNSAVAAGRSGKRALETSTYTLYLQAHSVTNLSSQQQASKSSSQTNKNASRNTTTNNNLFTQEQLSSILQLTHADHGCLGMVERRAFPFDLLVSSLCPAIIGHEMVKAGLLLSLLGGTPPAGLGDSKSHSIRSNSHILVVGDPGMGKSQMLLAVSQIAARSVYVGGNTTTTTGLTVTLTKEAGGEAGIEAGALVLADQGVCCIDEFDKMAKLHQDGLLEAMEQQQISIAKAGVVASLPARCAVIAAANPKQGSYNMSKTVAENLNMAPPILSRFDLVFVLRDRADSEQDKIVSSNIMQLYGDGVKSSQPRYVNPSNRPGGEIRRRLDGESTENRMHIRDRLLWVGGFQKDALPADLVRDYITYAREYCKPKLTQEAAAVLKDYFMSLRYPTSGISHNDTVPITTRQLEALIRLSQARAKACLREYVLEEDALDVVELMMESVHQVHTDESGTLDPTRGGAGGKSKRKVKKAFVQELKKINGAECSLDDLRRIAHNVNLELDEFSSFVDDLRNDGVLLKKGIGSYQVTA